MKCKHVLLSRHFSFQMTLTPILPYIRIRTSRNLHTDNSSSFLWYFFLANEVIQEAKIGQKKLVWCMGSQLLMRVLIIDAVSVAEGPERCQGVLMRSKVPTRSVLPVAVTWTRLRICLYHTVRSSATLNRWSKPTLFLKKCWKWKKNLF